MTIRTRAKHLHVFKDAAGLVGVYLLFWVLAIALFSLAGCASLPLKQQVSNGHQAVRLALMSFDDAEAALCAPDPAKPSHCTNPQAATIGLTDALHQKISAKLADAYDKDKLVARAIISWRAGDPAPTDLPTLIQDAQDTLSAVTSIAGLGPLLTKAQAVLDELAKLVAVLGGK